MARGALHAERDLRWIYCEFLKDIGMRLKVPQLTIATAIVFCHRFYSHQCISVHRSDLYIIASACMFLAGKVEETPKSLNDLLKVSTAVKHKDEDGRACSLMQDSNFVQEQRELVLRAERRLLHSLAFDFNIEHPYKYLLSTVKQMQGYCRISESSTRELAQTAWNFANDRYNLHHYCAMTIHATLTATKFMGSKLTLPKDWCTALDMDRCVCESISNEILDLYEMGNRDVYENIADLSALHG